VPRLLAFAQLVRLPNVFTAFADILLAACVVGYVTSNFVVLALMLAGSGCLYLAGMVWNDYFDRHDDAKTRPNRPIPSGRITLGTVRTLGFVLLLAGVACMTAAGFVGHPGSETLPVGFLVGVTLLVALILLYDSWLKHSPLGPLAMGGCRFLNVLLGCWAADASAIPPLVQWHAAGVVGLYIVGVTWFARTEEGTSRRGMLLAASAVMGVALALAAAVPAHFEPGHCPWYYLYLLVLFGFIIGWPIATAVRTPGAKQVQAAVKRCVLGLVLLDAVLACAFVGWPGLLVALLLVPALLLGRRVYST
jgi:4-hydroxybenzoate polyprenyltransferase